MANENTKRNAPRSLIAGLIALGFVLAAVGLYHSQGPTALQSALVGSIAPDFEFELESGGRQSLSSLKGKVVLVNFWAYWCEPCLEEMASLKRLQAHLVDRDFVLLMVHVGDEKEEALRIMDLPLNRVFDVPIGVLSAYGVSALPDSVLIDKMGVIRAEFRGPREWMSPELLKQIQEPLG